MPGRTAVYWPAMLLSAGATLPTDIFAHGFVTVEGAKISKSRGNAVDPIELVNRYGADALRYYLLREFSPASDGDFTFERFLRAYNNDLADRLGTLLNRAVRMVERYCDGVVPAPQGALPEDEPLLDAARSVPDAVARAMEAYEPNVALAQIWRLVDAANRYVELTEPWALAKVRSTGGAVGEEAAARLATALFQLVEALRLIGYLLRPFVPKSADALLSQLGMEQGACVSWEEATRWGGFPAGTRVRPGAVLFPKREEAQEASPR